MLSIETVLDLYENSDKESNGCSRFVHPISDDIVIKFPKDFNSSGDISQSVNELHFYMKRVKPQHQHLVAKLIDFVLLPLDPVEKPHYLSPTEVPILFFERVEPLPSDFLREFRGRSVLSVAQLWYGEEAGLAYYKELLQFCEETDLSDAISNMSNWGITKDGRLVCLDCGIYCGSTISHVFSSDFYTPYSYSLYSS